VRGMGGVAEAVGGVEDHVHLLVSMKTTDAPADLVRELKKASSLWAKENHVSLFPLIRGYRKAQPPATISHPSGMKMEKLGNSCGDGVKKMREELFVSCFIRCKDSLS